MLFTALLPRSEKRWLAAGSVVLALLTAACFSLTTYVVLLRSQLPALPAGCPVSSLADETAPFAVEDVAILTVDYTPGGKETALRTLQEKACYYAGDTLYRMHETNKSSTTRQITATVARRQSSTSPAASAAASSSP